MIKLELITSFFITIYKRHYVTYKDSTISLNFFRYGYTLANYAIAIHKIYTDSKEIYSTYISLLTNYHAHKIIRNLELGFAN